MFTVYILYSQQFKKFYIGYTSNLGKRLDYHNNGLSRFTNSYKPWILFYTEIYDNKTDAIKREKFLKRQKNHNFYNKLALGKVE